MVDKTIAIVTVMKIFMRGSEKDMLLKEIITTLQ